MANVEIKECSFGKCREEVDVKLYTLKNKNDFELSVISFGASVKSIKIKDKNQLLTNVCLGLDTIEEYCDPKINPYLGCSVGRVANRISNAEFKLNDVTYKLDKNNGNHCLHGGNSGLSMKNWASDVIENGVKFSYLSLNGEGGFPGEVLVEAIYKLDPDQNIITIQYNALTDNEPTPINLTNHTYFNLAGQSKKIYDHDVKIFADEYLDFNPEDVTVNGKINSVKNSKYDFTEFKRLANKMEPNGLWPKEGFDNFFVLNDKKSELKKVATVKNSSNGILLDVLSNQNGVQFYTGNYLDVRKKSGQSYLIHEGFCLETHNFPDSVNIPNFPSCILKPDEEYSNFTKLTFTVEN